MAMDVAAGLHALHDSEMIHEDIKASNVLVFNCGKERTQVVKVVDFEAAIF